MQIVTAAPVFVSRQNGFYILTTTPARLPVGLVYILTTPILVAGLRKK